MNYLFLSLALTAFATAADKPNIVWITSEDNSAHWLGCYGNKHTKTPNIDALAAQGVLYNAAFSNAPVCAIARSTLLMGRYATSMGTQNMRSRYPIPKTFKSYPQLLQEAGYHTHNASKTDYNIKGNDKAHWNVTGSKANPIKAPKGKPFISVINLMVSHESSLFASKIKNNKKNGTIPKTPSVKPEDVTLPPYLPDTKELRNDWEPMSTTSRPLISKWVKLSMTSKTPSMPITPSFSTIPTTVACTPVPKDTSSIRAHMSLSLFRSLKNGST